MKNVKYILLSYQREPKVLGLINELAYLESRKPLDTLKILVLEAATVKINKLKEQSQENNTQTLPTVSTTETTTPNSGLQTGVNMKCESINQ